MSFKGRLVVSFIVAVVLAAGAVPSALAAQQRGKTRAKKATVTQRSTAKKTSAKKRTATKKTQKRPRGKIVATRTVTAAPAGTATKVPGCISRAPYIGAIAIDADTGYVFFKDNADKPGYPASITKLMTLLLVLDDIRDGKYTVNDRATASVLASRQEPSSVGLKPGQSMTIDDLLYSIMIKSANDAAVVLAERAAGSVPLFVARMNARAAELGMKDTCFTSPNGLPPTRGSSRKPDTTTASDLVLLGREIVHQHPEALKYTHEITRTVTDGAGKPLSFTNHNLFLVRPSLRIAGCDGLKTGYTDAAGSSIMLTVERHGRRIIVVVIGSEKREMREEAAGRLMNDAWGALDCWRPALPIPQPPSATPEAAPAEAEPSPAAPSSANTDDGSLAVLADPAAPAKNPDADDAAIVLPAEPSANEAEAADSAEEQ